MIAKEAAKKQVLRLSTMDRYPQTAEALADLVRAVESAPDLGIAAKAITAIVDSATSETRCPAPGDLRRAIADAQRAAEGRQYWEQPQYEEPEPISDEERAETKRLAARIKEMVHSKRVPA